MSFLTIFLMSIDVLYGSTPSDWMLVSGSEVARILDYYFPPEVLINTTRNQYFYYGSQIIDYYETINAGVFLSIVILMCCR